MESQYQLKTGVAKLKWWLVGLFAIGIIGIVIGLIWLNLRPRRPNRLNFHQVSGPCFTNWYTSSD